MGSDTTAPCSMVAASRRRKLRPFSAPASLTRDSTEVNVHPGTSAVEPLVCGGSGVGLLLSVEMVLTAFRTMESFLAGAPPLRLEFPPGSAAEKWLWPCCGMKRGQQQSQTLHAASASCQRQEGAGKSCFRLALVTDWLSWQRLDQNPPPPVS